MESNDLSITLVPHNVVLQVTPDHTIGILRNMISTTLHINMDSLILNIAE